MSIQEFLQTKVPFLQGLTQEHIAALAQGVEQLRFKMGQTILFKGASVDGLHVIAEGKASVLIKPDKKAWVQVAELAEGDIFGETSIIEYKMASATIKAAADSTLIYVVPQSAFLDLLRTDVSLRDRIIKLIRDRQTDRHKDEPQKAETKTAAEAAAPAETSASEAPGVAAGPPSPPADEAAPS
ncbi:MAG: cyclic nucleotide-binding domain-containing protein [Elusimicrobiota bacterium]